MRIHFTSQWSGTWFGLIKIYTGSDISCHLRSSVSVSDPLKLKSGTWGLFIFIDFLVFIDFFLFFIVNMLKCINFSVYACVGYYFYYELNTRCYPLSCLLLLPTHYCQESKYRSVFSAKLSPRRAPYSNSPSNPVFPKNNL